jgi:hypothetical protein
MEWDNPYDIARHTSPRPVDEAAADLGCCAVRRAVGSLDSIGMGRRRRPGWLPRRGGCPSFGRRRRRHGCLGRPGRRRGERSWGHGRARLGLVRLGRNGERGQERTRISRLNVRRRWFGRWGQGDRRCWLQCRRSGWDGDRRQDKPRGREGRRRGWLGRARRWRQRRGAPECRRTRRGRARGRERAEAKRRVVRQRPTPAAAAHQQRHNNQDWPDSPHATRPLARRAQTTGTPRPRLAVRQAARNEPA